MVACASIIQRKVAVTVDLNQKYPPLNIPVAPYIGLFGNYHNNWRDWVRQALAEKGVLENQIYDSSDPGWQIVNDGNGDALQQWINELVRRQHHAMLNAECLIFSLDGNVRSWKTDSKSAIPDSTDQSGTHLFAARCELGWLAGIKKQTYVWIADDLQGRNYLRSVVDMYDNFIPVTDLSEACSNAALHLSKKC